MKHSITLLLILFAQLNIFCQHQAVLPLNGMWQFEQTEKAFPPDKFTRSIVVPGLIHLAEPEIEEYDKFFKKPDKSKLKTTHSVYNIDYTPMYSWYKKEILVPDTCRGKEAVLTIRKSQYGTRIYVNGHDFGTFMECYTPIQVNIARALRYGKHNEILICVGDRVWLPSQAAGGTDKEKEHYLPGIWDDVFISFSGKIRIDKALLLPVLKEKRVIVKTRLRNFYPAQIRYGDQMLDIVRLNIGIYEKKTKKLVSSKSISGLSKRDNLSVIETSLEIKQAIPWTPVNPFLYEAKLALYIEDTLTDTYIDHFGMRDFTRKGKYFYLNGEKLFLRGSNITLQRFFEDPECNELIWDREWVEKLLVHYPKQMHWNAMRICVGIVPDFWYDIADEHGIMFQNEWLYWQNHGWDSQIEKEYTEWVWSDGNHPSIVIWDGINENWDDYIGNELIPELMALDPTRIWDAGYMTSEQLKNGFDDMDEPHPYEGPRPWIDANKYSTNPYPLGNLDYRNEKNIRSMESGAAQLVNEYGWIWLWRNGEPAKLTVDVYKHYLGQDATPEERRYLQAYWLQLETEWLRSIRQHAGVLSFCYLTNNYGYTGDWFMNDIANLEPAPTLPWFRHAFAPAAVFINLTDERYTKFTEPHDPGTNLFLNLAGINDERKPVKGVSYLKLLDAEGNILQSRKLDMELPPDIRKNYPVVVRLPEQPGGYLLVLEFFRDGHEGPVISRRYIKVGNPESFSFYDFGVTPLDE